MRRRKAEVRFVLVDETVSIQSESDTSSEFSFVGYPTIIDENSQRISSSSAGDDQSVVGEAPDDDLEEDAPHQDDEPEDQPGDEDNDYDDDDDDLNHGDDVRRDDNDDLAGHDEVHDDDIEPSRLATPPAIPCPIPAPRRSSRSRTKPAWRKDFVHVVPTIARVVAKSRIFKRFDLTGLFTRIRFNCIPDGFGKYCYSGTLILNCRYI